LLLASRLDSISALPYTDESSAFFFRLLVNDCNFDIWLDVKSFAIFGSGWNPPSKQGPWTNRLGKRGIDERIPGEHFRSRQRFLGLWPS
jgi:hypothetical protein